jgi:hypothetical protein
MTVTFSVGTWRSCTNQSLTACEIAITASARRQMRSNSGSVQRPDHERL